jgi:hypothetical protein
MLTIHTLVTNLLDLLPDMISTSCLIQIIVHEKYTTQQVWPNDLTIKVPEWKRKY